jgi:hypothetical protein
VTDIPGKLFNGVMMLLGAWIFYLLWSYGILPGNLIWKIISGEIV